MDRGAIASHRVPALILTVIAATASGTYSAPRSAPLRGLRTLAVELVLKEKVMTFHTRHVRFLSFETHEVATIFAMNTELSAVVLADTQTATRVV